MKLTVMISIAIAIIASCTTPDTARTGTAVKFENRNETTSKTIVLIHGMFLTPNSWDPWKSYFEREGYKVYAPAWPMHDQVPSAMRTANPDSRLGKLTLSEVLDSYRSFIRGLPEKPILIGHSMGGLITQILLQEDLGVMGVAIDSAPPKGLISFKFSFIRSNWAVISPFANADEAYLPDTDAFHYAFTNCVSKEENDRVYERLATPESRRVGNASTTDVARIDFDKKVHPLLFIAGSEDHIIPASLNFANFEKYEDAPSATEFKMFRGRCHWIIGQDGWEEVAQFVKNWIRK